ncbi:MAG: TRAP transporter substrate-binding protein [Deltaproteobacteria bacterium]|nr:TRAP transporter substrate-binding protein [Deltaproteobacteria bacterium]
MKKSFFFFLCIALFFALSLCLLPSQSQAEPITLTYSNFFPPTHVQSKLAAAWCKEVEKRTNGQVKVQYFPGQTLTKAKQNYDGVVQGMSDIGFCLFAYTRGRFPVMEVVDLPLGYPSGVVATKVANDVYNKFKPKELDDVEVMYLHAHGPGLLFTRKKEVKTMEDLKGVKIRSHGTSAKVVEALGGTPVAMPMPELYQALQKGVVDGGLYPMEVNKGWKMAEVIDYCTLDLPIAYTSTFYVVMNKDKWNSLPKDVQATIRQINQEWVAKHGKAWDESDAAGKAYFLEKGGKIFTLSPEEGEKWKKAVAPVIDEYAADVEKKGLPGKELVTFTESSLEKYTN